MRQANKLLTQRWIAYAELTLSMMVLGSTFIMGKALVMRLPILLLLTLRFLIGTLFFAVGCGLNKKAFSGQMPSLKESLWLFLQAFFGAFLFNGFMLLGLRDTTANTAAMMTSTLPVFITLFSFLFLKESINPTQLVTIILSMLGLLLMTADIHTVTLNQTIGLGNLFILLAVVAGALFPICAKLTLTKRSTQITSLSFNGFGLLLFLPFAASEISQFQFHTITLKTWLFVISYSLMANVLYLHFWSRGLKKVNASTASLFIAIMPISTVILAYACFKEIPTATQMMGMFCVLLAIFWGIRRYPSRTALVVASHS